MRENIRDGGADSETKEGDIQHGIKEEGTEEIAVNKVNKLLFGINSYDDDDDDNDSDSDDYDDDHPCVKKQEVVSPGKRQKTIPHLVSTIPEEY